MPAAALALIHKVASIVCLTAAKSESTAAAQGPGSVAGRPSVACLQPSLLYMHPACPEAGSPAQAPLPFIGPACFQGEVTAAYSSLNHVMLCWRTTSAQAARHTAHPPGCLARDFVSLTQNPTELAQALRTCLLSSSPFNIAVAIGPPRMQ